jgi:glycerol-3-phosphate acyltransferase PlsY
MFEFSLILASYLIGSIPTAYLVVKWRFKVDIRKYGSGSVGGSNVFRNFSKPLGALVFIWDVAKGALVVWAAQMLHLESIYQIAIALAVVIGHNWPVFLKFNAGRGVATTLGAAFMLMPWLGFVFLTGIIIMLLFGNSPLWTLLGMAAMPIAAYFRQEPRLMTLGLLALFLIIVIRRLTPPRSERSKSISTRELLLNRLLLDRDIRDGKAWVRFKPAEIGKSGKQGKHK